jgi:hypothetical protein
VLTKAALLCTAIVWIACVTFFSLWRVGPQVLSRSIAHWIGHVIIFGVLTLLLLPLGRTRTQAWMILLSIFCLAGALELRQHQLFRQPFEWWDVRDDGIGALVALLLDRFTRIRALLLRK